MAWKDVLEGANIGKKIIDIIDDVVIAAKAIFAPVVATIVYASAVLVINALEFYEAQKKVRKAYKDEMIRQRKTKMTAASSAGVLSFAGMGLSTTLLLNVAGWVTIPSFIIEGILTPIIPGLLGCIYLGNLALNSYVLHQLKKDEKLAKADHEQYKSSWSFNEYNKVYEKKLKAEKKVAFATMELFCSAVVVIGVTLAALAVATAFPPALLIYAGVGLAVVSKTFEFFDNHKGPMKAIRDFIRKRRGLEPTPPVTPGRYTKPLRNFFRRVFKLEDDKPKQIERNIRIVYAPDSVSPIEEYKTVNTLLPPSSPSDLLQQSLVQDVAAISQLQQRDPSASASQLDVTPLGSPGLAAVDVSKSEQKFPDAVVESKSLSPVAEKGASMSSQAVVAIGLGQQVGIRPMDINRPTALVLEEAQQQEIPTVDIPRPGTPVPRRAMGRSA